MLEEFDPSGGLTLSGGIAAVLSCLGITNRKVRGGIVTLFKMAQSRWRRSKQIESSLYEILENQSNFSVTVAEITYELKTNGGGSIKDAVNRIEQGMAESKAHDNYRFRRLNYPSFECDSKGKNRRISDAYLDLLGIKSTVDIDSLDWQRFIHNDDIEQYFKAFERATESKSDFGHSARFYNDKLEPIGLWYVRAPRLESGFYIGSLIPQDDRAKEVYAKGGWVIDGIVN